MSSLINCKYFTEKTSRLTALDIPFQFKLLIRSVFSIWNMYEYMYFFIDHIKSKHFVKKILSNKWPDICGRIRPTIRPSGSYKSKHKQDQNNHGCL